MMRRAPRDRGAWGHAGQDGEAHRRAQCVGPTLVEACPSLDASERGQKAVRTLAGRVQTETQSHLKESLSSRVVCVGAPVKAIGGQPRRADRCGRVRAASTRGCHATSHSSLVRSVAACRAPAPRCCDNQQRPRRPRRRRTRRRSDPRLWSSSCSTAVLEGRSKTAAAAAKHLGCSGPDSRPDPLARHGLSNEIGFRVIH